MSPAVQFPPYLYRSIWQLEIFMTALIKIMLSACHFLLIYIVYTRGNIPILVNLINNRRRNIKDTKLKE